MATTLTLADFLLARIAEDEEAAITGDCRCEASGHQRPDCPDRILVECDTKREIVNQPRARCSEYVDPANPEDVQREAEYRAYVGEERYRRQRRDHMPAGYADHCEGCMGAESTNRQVDQMLKLLALPYADHADYRNEWRP